MDFFYSYSNVRERLADHARATCHFYMEKIMLTDSYHLQVAGNIVS
jgi:hypothetical protein